MIIQCTGKHILLIFEVNDTIPVDSQGPGIAIRTETVLARRRRIQLDPQAIRCLSLRSINRKFEEKPLKLFRINWSHLFRDEDVAAEFQFADRQGSERWFHANVVTGGATIDHAIRLRWVVNCSLTFLTRGHSNKWKFRAVESLNETYASLRCCLIRWDLLDVLSTGGSLSLEASPLSMGKSRVLPRCWLYCRHQASLYCC